MNFDPTRYLECLYSAVVMEIILHNNYILQFEKDNQIYKVTSAPNSPCSFPMHTTENVPVTAT